MGESWFDEARFGMFVHWDHASQQGLEVSWPLTGGVFALPLCDDISVAEYHASATTFDPREWNASVLARRARDAGMSYAVITAKHHSGYAMFHTRESSFSVEHSPCERDLVREFVDALREEGLRVGIYFSLSDWHHPDYPAFTDADKPYVFGMSPPLPTEDQWDRYHAFMTAQLRELLTGYGTIDVLWFDGGWERPFDYWRPTEVEQMIRELQPDILINDRLLGVADFTTPEQIVPATAPPGRWETCMTMNHSWGYVPSDTGYKSARELVHTLCETAGKGGNLLLNVSPTGTGALPREQIDRLDAINTWMDTHGESIVATEPGLEPWQFYGPSTRRGNRVYLHLLMRPYDRVTVRGVPIRRVVSAHVLGREAPLELRKRTGILDSLTTDPLGEVSIAVPESALDSLATVIALDFADDET